MKAESTTSTKEKKNKGNSQTRMSPRHCQLGKRDSQKDARRQCLLEINKKNLQAKTEQPSNELRDTLPLSISSLLADKYNKT